MLPRLVSRLPVGLSQPEVLEGDGTQEEGEGLAPSCWALCRFPVTLRLL